MRDGITTHSSQLNVCYVWSEIGQQCYVTTRLQSIITCDREQYMSPCTVVPWERVCKGVFNVVKVCLVRETLKLQTKICPCRVLNVLKHLNLHVFWYFKTRSSIASARLSLTGSQKKKKKKFWTSDLSAPISQAQGYGVSQILSKHSAKWATFLILKFFRVPNFF